MDRSTPNLPSRDFDLTRDFYAGIGFVEVFRNHDWLILTRGQIVLEFFPHPTLDPAESWFSCCLRLDDVDGFFAKCKAAGIPEATTGHPRVHAPSGGPDVYMGALLDPDGSLLRFIRN